MTVAEQDELVAALLGIVGVAAAAVEPVDEGPGTLRLQLAPGVDEVGVAGEVNHLLRSRFGLAVDTDRVRVIDEPEDEQDLPGTAGAVTDGRDEGAVAAGHAPVVAAEVGGEPAPPHRGRLVIDRVQMSSAGLTTSVTVSLGAGQDVYQGTAEGTATTGSLHRAVAMATLHALEAVVEGRARFDVEHVEIAETGDQRTALVVLTMVTERATQRLSGASVVREDTRQAVIRGVLAAVNRRLGPLLRREDALL